MRWRERADEANPDGSSGRPVRRLDRDCFVLSPIAIQRRPA